MKTTQIVLEAGKKYGGYTFDEEAIKRAFDPDNEFPITIKFYPGKYVGWARMISCEGGKIKVEMELSPAGESLIRKEWTLICSGRVTDMNIKPWNFIIDSYALVPPVKEK